MVKMVCRKIGTNVSRAFNKMVESCKLNCPALPIAEKCCFCVPVRKGVIIFGYFYLALELLSLSLYLLLLLVELDNKDKPRDNDGNSSPMDILVGLWLSSILIVIDIFMTVVLLIGAHKNKKSLLKFYLYFEVALQLVALWVDIHYFDFHEYIENTAYFITVGLNIYLLYLVYSMMKAFEENTQVHYVEYRENFNQNI